jgi:sugar lactone lactonase YvrE
MVSSSTAAAPPFPRFEVFMILALLAACSGPSTDDTSTPAEACAADSGNICTWAGTGDAAFYGDGMNRLEAMFYWPMDVEFSPLGKPVISDWNNHRLRIVEDDDTVQTIVGGDFPGDGPPDQSDLTPPGAPGTTVLMNHPTDMQYQADGTLLIAAWHNHKLRVWDPATGNVTVHCGLGSGFMPASEEETDATGMLLNMPSDVAVAPDGTIYFVDQKNERVRMLTPEFTVATVAGNGTKGFAGDGGDANDANFAFPLSAQPEPGGSVAIGPDGNLYVVDTENSRVRMIDMTTGTIDTVVGNGTAAFAGDGGPAVDASLNFPRDIEFDADGLMYIADTDNHAIRTVDISTGVIQTVVGIGGTPGFSGEGGPATEAELDRPFGIDFDNDGNLMIADTYNHRIRVVYK